MSSTDTSVDDTGTISLPLGLATVVLIAPVPALQKVSSQLFALNDPSVRLRGQGLGSVNN